MQERLTRDLWIQVTREKPNCFEHSLTPSLERDKTRNSRSRCFYDLAFGSFAADAYRQFHEKKVKQKHERCSHSDLCRNGF
jgi:hypothetical protein